MYQYDGQCEACQVLLVPLDSQQSLILTVLCKEMDSCTSAMTMASFIYWYNREPQNSLLLWRYQRYHATSALVKNLEKIDDDGQKGAFWSF